MDKALFEQLLASVKEMDEIRRGKRKPSRIFEVVDVKGIRKRTGLSQAEFARLVQVSKGTLLNWEQGRRQPTGPARALLTAVANDPEHVLKALHGAAKA